MSRKRKYEAIQGYWVYTIKVPSVNKFYIGVSKLQCYQRWQKSLYKDTALESYLDEWDSMIKTVLVDNLTKEEAYQYEDNIIRALSLNHLCINSNRSGLIADDINAYQRGLKKTNTEYHERCNQLCKQWRLDNPEYYKQYRENNREKINEYQRQRYQTDAEYREHEKQRQRQRRLEKKLEQQQQTSVH